MIKAILACDEKWGIGKDGNLPWPHNPEDLKWFKETTVGGVVAMGKTTWDSLPTKPLPNRNNIVVTSSQSDYNGGSYHFVKFKNAKIELLNMSKLQTVWVIGGAQLFNSLIDIIDELHLSRIEGVYDCDTFLPEDVIEDNFYMKEVNHYEDKNLYIEVWGKK